jgi:hypothetical protein
MAATKLVKIVLRLTPMAWTAAAMIAAIVAKKSAYSAALAPRSSEIRSRWACRRADSRATFSPLLPLDDSLTALGDRALTES